MMTTLKLKIYIALGLLVKVTGLLFLAHYDGPSSHTALAYFLALLCLLVLRPIKKSSSTI